MKGKAQPISQHGGMHSLQNGEGFGVQRVEGWSQLWLRKRSGHHLVGCPTLIDAALRSCRHFCGCCGRNVAVSEMIGHTSRWGLQGGPCGNDMGSQGAELRVMILRSSLAMPVTFAGPMSKSSGTSVLLLGQLPRAGLTKEHSRSHEVSVSCSRRGREIPNVVA